MLNADDLRQLRSLQNEAMDKFCLVQRAESPTPNDQGSFTQTWTSVYYGPCNLRGPATQNERLMATRITEQLTRSGVKSLWFVVMPYGTDVKVEDRIFVFDSAQTILPHDTYPIPASGSRFFQVVNSDAEASFSTATKALVDDDGQRI